MGWIFLASTLLFCICDSLGKAEVYIFLALLIGFVTVVVGCWLSDNCWSPEPEGVVTLA